MHLFVPIAPQHNTLQLTTIGAMGTDEVPWWKVQQPDGRCHLKFFSSQRQSTEDVIICNWWLCCQPPLVEVNPYVKTTEDVIKWFMSSWNNWSNWAIEQWCMQETTHNLDTQYNVGSLKIWIKFYIISMMQIIIMKLQICKFQNY